MPQPYIHSHFITLDNGYQVQLGLELDTIWECVVEWATRDASAMKNCMSVSLSLFLFLFLSWVHVIHVAKFFVFGQRFWVRRDPVCVNHHLKLTSLLTCLPIGGPDPPLPVPTPAPSQLLR